LQPYATERSLLRSAMHLIDPERSGQLRPAAQGCEGVTRIMRHNPAICALMIMATLSACSTRPRNFAPTIATTVADDGTFEDIYRTCAGLVAQGRSSDFKATAATLAATGAGTVGAAFAATSVGAVGITGGALTSAVSVAVPGLGLLAGFGLSRAIRSGNERKHKARMATCLGEYGYAVSDWARIDRRADPAAVALFGAPHAEPETAPNLSLLPDAFALGPNVSEDALAQSGALPDLE
jgi:hypothetical protein